MISLLSGYATGYLAAAIPVTLRPEQPFWAMGTVFALLLVAHDHFLYKEPEKE